MIFRDIAGTTGKDLYYTSRPAIGAPVDAPIAQLPFDSSTTSEETSEVFLATGPDAVLRHGPRAASKHARHLFRRLAR